MDKKLKAAVIGLGRMGAQPSFRLAGRIPNGWLPISHAEAIGAIPELELCAFCDSDKERLAHFGNHYKVYNLFEDYKQLIDMIRPDFLCIATRMEGRTDIIKYACTHGVQIIYFEKPVSKSILDCRETLDIAAQYDVKLGYGVNRHYHEVYQKAKTLLQLGEVGTLKSVIVEHGLTNLLWSHPHSVDLLMYFADTVDIVSIQASCIFTNGYTPTDLCIIDNDPLIEYGIVCFKNGVKGIINEVTGNNTRLVCDNGIITICSDGSYLEIRRLGENGYLGEPEIIRMPNITSATIRAFKGLLGALKGDKPMITPSEILGGVILLNGFVLSSLCGGKKISVENIPKNMIVTGKSGVFYA